MKYLRTMQSTLQGMVPMEDTEWMEKELLMLDLLLGLNRRRNKKLFIFWLFVKRGEACRILWTRLGSSIPGRSTVGASAGRKAMSLFGCCFPSIPIDYARPNFARLSSAAVMHMFAPEVIVRGIKLIVMTGDVRQIYGSAGGDTSKNRGQVIVGSGPNS